jgi:NAD(P)-dependent dehydrogenase (short-subunit alcohol dehydrogenase family)
VNVLGTYSMTELILPLLENAATDARVITVSSGGMYTAPLTTDLQVTFVVKFFTVIFTAGYLWNSQLIFLNAV